jgi:hypothetical protein
VNIATNIIDIISVIPRWLRQVNLPVRFIFPPPKNLTYAGFSNKIITPF